MRLPKRGQTPDSLAGEVPAQPLWLAGEGGLALHRLQIAQIAFPVLDVVCGGVFDHCCL